MDFPHKSIEINKSYMIELLTVKDYLAAASVGEQIGIVEKREGKNQ